MPSVEDAPAIAAFAIEVPGVAALHGGPFGEVRSFLPGPLLGSQGRVVPGIRVDDDGVEIHIVITDEVPAIEVADRLRTLLSPAFGRIDVFVEDVQVSTAPTPPDPTPVGGDIDLTAKEHA